MRAILLILMMMISIICAGCSDISEKEAKNVIENHMDIFMYNKWENMDNMKYVVPWIMVNEYGDLSIKEIIKKHLDEARTPNNWFYYKMSTKQKDDILEMEEKVQMTLNYKIDKIETFDDVANITMSVEYIDGEVLNENVKNKMLSEVRKKKEYESPDHGVYYGVQNVQMYDEIKPDEYGYRHHNRRFVDRNRRDITNAIVDMAYKVYLECLKEAPIKEKCIEVQMRKNEDGTYFFPEWTVRKDGKNKGYNDGNRDFLNLHYQIWYHYCDELDHR